MTNEQRNAAKYQQETVLSAPIQPLVADMQKEEEEADYRGKYRARSQGEQPETARNEISRWTRSTQFI